MDDCEDAKAEDGMMTWPSILSTPLDQITADQQDDVLHRVVSRPATAIVVLASFQSAI